MREASLHDALNGAVSIEAGDLAILNPTENLPVGIGPWQDGPFQTGRTQNVRTTWTEQGWGHESQRWATFPYSVLDNPARVRSRLSSLSEAERENFGLQLDSWTLSEGHQAERQMFWSAARQNGAQAHGAVIDIPDAVPYTDTVPAYAGGAIAHPGVDIPLGLLYGG